MVELHEFDIEDKDGTIHQYKVNALPATTATTILIKILKMIGAGEGSANVESIGMAVLGNLDAEESVSIAKRLLGKEVLRDNRPVNFDNDYRGNISEMMKAVIEILKFNFKDFGELGNLLGGSQ